MGRPTGHPTPNPEAPLSPQSSATNRIARAEEFRRLHQDVFLLPNAWDPPSAYALATAGAPALATTSAGIAWSRGVPDGGGLAVADALDAFERIAATVDLPVSADLERGYADSPAEIAANVAEFVERGASGVNLEDATAGSVVPLADQVVVLERVRAAIDRTGIPAFLNARTDVFLRAAPDADPEDLLSQVVDRAGAYRAAGADGLFVTGLSDSELIRRLCGKVELPVNIGPVTTDRDDLRALGVRRVTWGPTLAMSTYGFVRDRVATVLSGEPAAQAAMLNLTERWPS
ncbi:isocitrate lyase/PEP mutase family protein [Microlunatus parietis]|uniref:2-methylisocitrate lyase-like PEP mutase family enzyme n=1 Tax=Microlunatus parietis TaxID=682979 RepID=A0A7Y9IDE9_9ACTN|nr:isocitrate lyase/phosphoenolpyruvate mutase family protein [Microlunatus parietis]NYE74891.1 2-methylisocitrate lyase-like PEP mutase family enzyme [Microlunatus parietis]